jgi:predicted glycosyltransferase
LIYQNEDWIQIDGLILGAEKIVSRFGYSTWMDMVFLQKKAELNPTIKQAEQIYLAELHKGKM